MRVRTTQAILLNYRKDGSPFWNLLEVRPLHRCVRPTHPQAATKPSAALRRAAASHALVTRHRRAIGRGCSDGAFRGFSARIVDLSREIEYVDRCVRKAETERTAITLSRIG